ncbi:LAME_0H09054g1_1 [Lachancea meyersii CBS 8951]|uniref:LAME_0H09054g1_1 n=1 Tax=Lachancea meyersii CBS 8951 TaxID=1266667 RepID=A0A1G4KFD1_9SACH|nr:LAME_0H09054g1_1 [Lachancea meyersii CBS 8951]
MSSLRVLAVGDNTNVLLYAWRIQQSKSVNLTHLSSAKTSEYSVETAQYGSDTFCFEQHFESVDQMLASGDGSARVFDLVILSAASLQELSSLAAKLNPVLNLNTKILVESSGFVHLEPFVKMSIDFGQLKVFSVMCDFDFRQVSPSRFEQAAHQLAPCNLYLGESGVKGSTKYAADNVALLETFKRLFVKLFPQDKVHVCNFSYAEFLSQQWKLALPRICFDPLYILLENSRPEELNEQILAKPLISGLVTEIITVTKTMGAKLPPGFDNEKDLLQQWLKTTNNELPQLAYHFCQKTAPLNVDMLLLQPILLADDYGIKTPYLEFLYSMMCQYQKMNDGESKLFARTSIQSKVTGELTKLQQEHIELKSQLHSVQNNLATTSQSHMAQIKARDDQEHHQKNEIAFLKGQIAKLNSDLANEQRKVNGFEANHKKLLQDQQHLQQQLQIQQYSQMQLSQQHQPQPQQERALEGSQAKLISSESASKSSSTGTPNLRDIEDIAVYGVHYGLSPSQRPQPDAKEAQPVLEAATSATGIEAQAANTYNNARTLPVEGAGTDLRERELELRRRELELQEKELELQRRSAVRPRPNKYQSASMLPSHGGPGPTVNGQGARKPSYSQAGSRNNRQMHGAAQPGIPNMIDPVGMQHSFGQPSVSGVPGQLGPAIGAPIGGTSGSQGHPHQFKTTSRKNRRSNMPNLRHASSVDVLSMAGTGTAPHGAPPSIAANSSGTRLNSMAGNGPPPSMMLNRPQNGSGLHLNNIPTPSLLGPKAGAPYSAGPASSVPQQQFRQISSSTVLAEDPVQANISSHTVVHNPVPQQVFNGHSSGSSLSAESPSAMSPNGNMTVSDPSPISISEVNGQDKTPVPTQDAGTMLDTGFELDAKDATKKKSKFGLFGKKRNKN